MKKQNYVLGLDLGTNSIGWACINEESQEILDAGVRIFDAAENPKTKESLAKPRREARLTRRRLHRRWVRLQKLANLLVQQGFIKDIGYVQSPYEGNMWALRVQALDEKLSNEELARVIYHITKARGFKSSKKEVSNNTDIEPKKEKTEEEKANKAMKTLVEEFQKSQQEFNYRTIGEYLFNTYKDSHIRNKFGTYTHLIKQDLNEQELRLILSIQKEKGNNLINDFFEKELFELFTFRKGLPSFEEKVGACALEPEFKRAPKDALTSSLFRAWSDLNHIRYQQNSDSPLEILSLEKREKLIQLAFDRANEGKAPTAVQIGNIMEVGQINQTVETKKVKEYLMNFDMKKIIKSLTFSSYTKLKNITEDIGLWDKIKDNVQAIDSLIYVIAYLKEVKNLKTLEDSIIKEQISHLKISNEQWERLFELSFDGTMGHSLQAMWQMLPYFQLEKDGKPYAYNECVEGAYEGKFNSRKTENKNFVPKFNEHDITNPVVKRTLNQTRLLINKLISSYGKPAQINIEMARDLGKSAEDRNKIDKQMKENQDNNAKYWEKCQELSIHDPIMYRLWKEQGEICIYSGKSISITDMQRNNVEIDHILPISQSGDDSLMNKVLVFSYENQNKGNRTAFEYLKSKGEQALEAYKIRVKNSHLRYKKQNRLLLENFDTNASLAYKTRHLNDTRYIAKALVQHLDKTIRPEGQNYNYVKTLPGQATSILRKLWGLKAKDRLESHKHHALDAILIAGAGSKIKAWEKEVTNIVKYRYQDDKGLSLGEKAQKNIERFGMHIEAPWESFADDARNFIDNIFVSRLGKRKVSGEMHAQTILSRQQSNKGEIIVKTLHLQNIGKTEDDVLKNLKNMVDVSFENGEVIGRNAKVYQIIVDHAKKFDWKMDEAFNEENAPSMPVTKTNPVHIPKIRKIKISASASSELKLKNISSEKRQAAVDSGNVIRLDLFRDNKGKFFVLPIYPFHYKELPQPEEKHQAQFIFSIYKNDYLVVSSENPFIVKGIALTQMEGYWNTYATETRIVIINHDNQNKAIIKTSKMDQFKKYYIDILGGKHFVASSEQPEEKRLSLKEVEALWKDKNSQYNEE